MERQTEVQIDKDEIAASVKREIIRVLKENCETIVRRATIPERAVVFVEPDIKIREFAEQSLMDFIGNVGL